MIEPLISIIMPAYNAQKYLAKSIESVIAQTYPNWELVIVDDGSTDETANIVKRFQSNDDRIVYLYRENGKQGKARNTGIIASRGEYLAFLDADDMWVSEKLKTQWNVLKSRPDIDLLFTQGFVLHPDGKITDYNINIKDWNWTIDHEKLIDWNQIPILSVIVKKKAVLAVDGFSENPLVQNAEDYHLWLKLLHKGYTFLSIGERLFYYRIHSSQATYQNKTIYKAILYCYFDLINTGILDSNMAALRYRCKCMILDHVNPQGLYHSLRHIFSDRKISLFIYTMFPSQQLFKRMANRFL